MTREQQIESALGLRQNLQRIVQQANSTKKERALIRQLTDEIFGTAKVINKGCGNCWGDALVDILLELQIPISSKPTPMNNQQFQLKDGKLLMAFGQSTGYTRKTLTDAQALKELKRIPESKREAWLGRMFDKFPSDWAEQLQSVSEEGDKVLSEGPAVSIENTDNDSQDKQPEVVDFAVMNYASLKAYATEKQFPEAEWKKKNRNQLIAYLIEKTAKA